MHIIAVVGGRKSGKTTAVEVLVEGLVEHGYKVATVKHVSQKNFTMDTEGKDTWRHAKAGASITATQDGMNRHRGAKPCRRCELLGKISLLSPEYLLSVRS